MPRRTRRIHHPRSRAGRRAPSEIIAELTSPAFDASASIRQYGVASVLGTTAAYTGSDDGTFAGDRQGAIGTIVYALQGNILTSSAVVEQAASAFENTGCDLPERLMRALEAGAEHGEGDRRCTSTRGIPSDSAFLRIAAGDVESAPTHPCDEDDTGAPPGPGGGSAGGGSAGTGPAGEGDPGCGCDLPRGRPSAGLGAWIAAVAAGLAARQRRGRKPLGVPSAVSRQ